MARFDVYQTTQHELLLDCQSDLLTGVRTRLVAPLLSLKDVSDKRITRLMPVFVVNDSEVVMVTTLLVGLPINELGKRVGSLADEQDAIMSAIDMLLTGF